MFSFFWNMIILKWHQNISVMLNLVHQALNVDTPQKAHTIFDSCDLSCFPQNENFQDSGLYGLLISFSCLIWWMFTKNLATDYAFPLILWKIRLSWLCLIPWVETGIVRNWLVRSRAAWGWRAGAQSGIFCWFNLLLDNQAAVSRLQLDTWA